MPQIHPIPAIGYPVSKGGDLSDRIAPPYDVLTAESKAALLATNEHNIVAVDLPHTPAKTVGPDEAYSGAGERFAQWLTDGVLQRRDQPALFAYQQVYTVGDRTYHRKGLIANVRIQDFGPGPDGKGGIFPHEETFSAAKEDRLKLMRATQAQLSPIFGLYSDSQLRVAPLLEDAVQGDPSFFGVTANDRVRHEAFTLDTDAQTAPLLEALADADVFIADGHHRYNTALNYKRELEAELGHELPEDHPASWCLFVLVAMQDPGMIVLPTHRVLGGMHDFSVSKLAAHAGDALNIEPFEGDSLEALEAALPEAGEHAMGLYESSTGKLFIANTPGDDPLADSHAGQSDAWRKLDVAVLQHLIVKGLLEPNFCAAGEAVAWKFPHELAELKRLCDSGQYQVGVVMQPTPLGAVREVSEAGELMPQKSTFFYPKLATGLAVNPLG